MQEVSQAFDFRHEQSPAHSVDWHFTPSHLSTGKGSEIVMSAAEEVAEEGKHSSQESLVDLCLLQYIHLVWQNNLAGFFKLKIIFVQDDRKI